MASNPVPGIVNLVNHNAIAADSCQRGLFDQVFTAEAVNDFRGAAAFSGLEAIRQVFGAIHDGRFVRDAGAGQARPHRATDGPWPKTGGKAEVCTSGHSQTEPAVRQKGR